MRAVPVLPRLREGVRLSLGPASVPRLRTQSVVGATEEGQGGEEEEGVVSNYDWCASDCGWCAPRRIVCYACGTAFWTWAGAARHAEMHRRVKLANARLAALCEEQKP